MTWANEIEFSNWLHGNINELGKALGLDLVARQREAAVGRLSADLLATIGTNGDAVIIENQIHAADHGHFGQVLTYASHYDAKVIVWISTRFREEYRVAFAWLNSLCAKRFYAVELGERDRNGNPTFTVVAAGAAAPMTATITPASRHAAADATGGWHLPAPFAVSAPRDVSPAQFALNAMFERIAARLSGSTTFPKRRSPTGDRNYFVIANGPVRQSEWSIVFTNEGVRIELVFNDRESSVRDIERVRAHASELRSLIGRDVDFHIVPTQAKQKVMVCRSLSIAERTQGAEDLAAWCVDTITTLALAVAKLGIFETASR